MSDDFKVTGAEDFLRLSKALKEAGRLETRKELTKAIREAVKPVIPQTRSAALARLPKRGGLADLVAKEPQRVQVRTGAATAGARLVVGKKKGAARAANVGVIRHPVFGDKNDWKEQKVTPGWFDDTVDAAAPEIRKAVEGAMQKVIDTIVKGG